jgi:hypothetical protein
MEDRAQEDAEHRPRQVRIEDELVPRRHGHGEDPLADGHVGQDAIDEVRGELAHPPAATGRAKAAALAAERDHGALAAALTPYAQQTVAEDATAKVRLELTLHEPRQSRVLGIAGRLGEEGLEVGLDGPVEHGAFGLAALVGGRGGA